MRMGGVRPAGLLCVSLVLNSCGNGGSVTDPPTTDPPTPTRALLVTKAGGVGTVASTPPGIDCGPVCSAEFPEGTVVTLTVSANSGYAFFQWSGACAGSTATCQVTMTAPQAVTAEFVEGPIVLYTVPGDGETDVDPMFDRIEIHFSEPMAGCAISSTGWYPYTGGYSDDRTTIYLTRESTGTPLHGQRVRIRVLSENCRAVEGHYLTGDYSFVFTTEWQGDPPIRVEADPAKGFHWPYYLVPPSTMASPPTLLVEPNNSGQWSDDQGFHEDRAVALMKWRMPFAEDLGSPLLIPVFPRPINPQAPEPGGIYTQALDRYSLTTTHAGIQRVDLQLVAMIDDALERLEAMGHQMDRRVFMMGFSASGAFTSRFTIIHPDRVKAAAPGAPGSWPTAPLAAWEGTPLRYPIGVADLHELVGRPFDLETFRTVPHFIYVGDQDANDGLDVRGMTMAERNQVRALLNWPADLIQANRWPLAKAMYDSVGADARFVVYPGIGHTITPSMLEDIKEFFRAHR